MLQYVILSSLFYSIYYFLSLAKRPRLFYNTDKADSFWNDKLKIPNILKKVWYPPFFLGVSHLQNLFYEGIILKSRETYYDERVELEAEDGGIFAIDIKYPSNANNNEASSRPSSRPQENETSKSNMQKEHQADLKNYKNQFSSNSNKKHSKHKMTLKLHKKGIDSTPILDENNNPIFNSSNIPPSTNFQVDEIILIYPGITGKSPDPYIKRIVNAVEDNTKSEKKKIKDRKILTAVMIQRGYDGLEISDGCKKLNGVTNILDLKTALKYLDDRFNKTGRGAQDLDVNLEASSPEKIGVKGSHTSTPVKKIMENETGPRRSITRIVAFSFGAIQTRLLLGGPKLSPEDRKQSWYPKAVLCNSCPFNLISTTFEKFEVGLAGLFYNRQITKRMSSILAKHKLLPENTTLSSLLSSCKVMRHLDEKINAPSWGYKGWREYYNAATITPEHLMNIEIPVIFLNSVDDPLIKDSPETDKWFTNTKWVMLVKTTAGGHWGLFTCKKNFRLIFEFWLNFG